MGLIKSIPDPSGPGTIDAYARYGPFSFNPDDRRIDLAVYIYRSKAARDAMAGDGRPLYAPIIVERYSLTDSGASGPDGPLSGAPDYGQYKAADEASPTGTIAKIYGFLKNFTPWQGSADA